MASTEASPSTLTPLERAIWKQVQDRRQSFGYSYYSQDNDPEKTSAGQLWRRFPREKWFHALALRQAIGYGSLGNQKLVLKWATQGEHLDPTNAFYSLMVAKVWGERPGQKAVAMREAALQRAARGQRFDDGSLALQSVGLGITRKVGVETWMEKWTFWSDLDSGWYMVSYHLDNLLRQFATLSQRDSAVTAPRYAKAKHRAALRRSAALMRVSLLLQKNPCGSNQWRAGENFAREAWRVGRTRNTYWGGAKPTATQFIAFAQSQKDSTTVALAQKCAARLRLLAPFTRVSREGPLFTPIQRFWAEASQPMGFGVLAFGFYQLAWWWLVSMFSWLAPAPESPRRSRLVPASIIIGLTLAAYAIFAAVGIAWTNAQSVAGTPPPTGQVEVFVAWGIFAFFAPPLWLALWCAVRTYRLNRVAFQLPARAQIEMNLAPLDSFMLARATGAFALALLGVAFGLTLFWGFLRWQGSTGYDWLRFLFPGVSARVVDPMLTSIDSPLTPVYSGLCVIALTFIWFIAWRYSTDPERRPILHGGLRAWKETLGCAVTCTVWVYLVFLVMCHVSGLVLEKRLELASKNGEGTFVRGF